MNDPVAAGHTESSALGPAQVAAARLVDVEPDGAVGASLPGGHPAWRRDAVSVSARVRAVLATLKPVVVQVLSFWDHAVRSVRIGGRVLEVDPSGCYRRR